MRLGVPGAVCPGRGPGRWGRSHPGFCGQGPLPGEVGVAGRAQLLAVVGLRALVLDWWPEPTLIRCHTALCVGQLPRPLASSEGASEKGELTQSL